MQFTKFTSKAANTMNRILVMFALFLLARPSVAQQLTGVWFSPALGGLLEVVIDQLSIRAQLVSLDFTAPQKRAPEFLLSEVSAYADREILLVPIAGDTTQFRAFVAFDIVRGRYFRHAWNVLDTVNNQTLAQLKQQVSAGDWLQGRSYYSARYIDTLRQLRPLDSMTKLEFKQYILAYTTAYLCNYSIFKQQSHYAVKAFNFDMLTETLYEGGFNPLQNRESMNALFQRHTPNKKLLRKLQLLLGE